MCTCAPDHVSTGNLLCLSQVLVVVWRRLALSTALEVRHVNELVVKRQACVGGLEHRTLQGTSNKCAGACRVQERALCCASRTGSHHASTPPRTPPQTHMCNSRQPQQLPVASIAKAGTNHSHKKQGKIPGEPTCVTAGRSCRPP